jgi:hypothetical protein
MNNPMKKPVPDSRYVVAMTGRREGDVRSREYWLAGRYSSRDFHMWALVQVIA